MRRIVPLTFFLLCSGSFLNLAAAEEEPSCHFGQAIIEQVAGHTVRLEPVAIDPVEKIFECRAAVLAPGGAEVNSHATRR